MSETIQGYCVKCKTQREMSNPEAIFTDNARPAVRGTCPECGTKMFRFGATALHDGMTPPEPKPRPKKKKSEKKASAKEKKKKKASRARRGNLVIVESPAKARTIGKFLGSGYEVRASLGHVRDLLKSRLSVEVEDNFEPTYRVPNEKRETVKELAKAAGRAKEIWLATDPDREGEAIAWHLLEAAEIPPDRVRRVVFHEITPSAVADAFAHPRDLDMNLVDAQQARRILDRLVGFQLSPLLWKKVRGRLSAGRVQSVALRMIVEREREVRDFVPDEYWTISAEYAEATSRGDEPRPAIAARLHRIHGESPSLNDEESTEAHLAQLRQARYLVSDVRRTERRRNPSAPFTTSTLQQEASRRLGFGANRTMSLAQSLYEGVPLVDGESVGLITYMRTDSVNVSAEAANEARRYISDSYGAEYVPEEVPSYQSRNKKAQEAHEAIRPTSVARTPESVKRFLDARQFNLYELIWQRFVASQMAPAQIDRTAVDIVADTTGQIGARVTTVDAALVDRLSADSAYLLRATGSVIRFAGFLALYEESRDEDDDSTAEEALLVDLETGELLDLLDIGGHQHFTQPPPRYSEATLVRALEENGIGRPSTYAPTVNTLYTRGYVERDGRRLVPTELGDIVTTLLVDFFPDVLDVGFTALMEDELDDIADGEREWPSVLHEFYAPFNRRLLHAQEEMEEVELEDEPAGIVCDKCGRDMVVKWGRYGKFIACPGFPECRNTIPYLELIGVDCPDCETGELAEKRTKRGRIFYGCSNYPDCDFSSWKRPVNTPCPDCGGLLVDANKAQYQCLQCEQRFAKDDVLETQAVTQSG